MDYTDKSALTGFQLSIPDFITKADLTGRLKLQPEEKAGLFIGRIMTIEEGLCADYALGSI